MNRSIRVIGVGNPILKDDKVGIDVALEIGELRPNIDTIDVCAGALGVFDYIVDWDRIIMIDSIKSGRDSPGTVYQMQVSDFSPVLDQPTTHGLDIISACRLGEGLGYKVPIDLSIYAIEIEDNATLSEACTPAISARIQEIAQEIIEEEAL